MKIIVEYVHPPIPVRDHDWCAWLEEADEDGSYGWGSTQAEAVKDLLEQLKEKQE